MDPLCLRVQFSGTIHHHIPGPAALCVTLSVLWGREGRATPAIQPPRALLWTFNPLPPGCKTSWPPNSGPRGLKNLPDSFAPPFKWVPGWIKLSYLDSEKTKQNKKQKPEKMNLCPSVIYWHIFLKSIPFLEFLFFIFFLIRTENSRLSGRYLTTTLHATLWAGRAVCVQTDRSSLHILGEAAPLPPPPPAWFSASAMRLACVPHIPVYSSSYRVCWAIFGNRTDFSLLSFLLLKSLAWSLHVGVLFPAYLTGTSP